MKHQENVSFRLKNIMPRAKKLWEEHLFPLEKLFFLPSVEKNNHFSSGNKSSPQSFSVPGIMFPARRNIYSHQISNFCKQFTIPKHFSLHRDSTYNENLKSNITSSKKTYPFKNSMLTCFSDQKSQELQTPFMPKKADEQRILPVRWILIKKPAELQLLRNSGCKLFFHCVGP